MLLKVTDSKNLRVVGFAKFQINLFILGELMLFANLQVLTQKQGDKK